MKHVHDDFAHFRSMDEYSLAVACPQCRAPIGHPCWTVHRAMTFHKSRHSNGYRWLRQDQRRSPVEWQPGICYSTLPGCKS